MRNKELYECARLGTLKGLRRLLDSNADANYRSVRGYTPMMIAAEQGHVECLELLIQVGNADVHTALLLAGKQGHLDCVQVLIANKGDIHFQSNVGSNVLMEASRYGHADCLQYLIEKKANLEMECKHRSRTPLIVACLCGQAQSCSLLLDAKADVNHADWHGRTAIDRRQIFRERGNKSVLGFLLHCFGAQYTDKEEQESARETADAIGNYHTELTDVLSYKVIVDRRVGLKQDGLYHEPLERVLQYCGLDLVMEGDPNIQQDDPIPKLLRGCGRARSAEYWYYRTQDDLLALE